MSTGCFIHANATRISRRNVVRIYEFKEKQEIKIIYHWPNGKGLLSTAKFVEFCFVFVVLLICFGCLSCIIFSIEDLIRDRTRRGFRFCT